MNGKTLVKAAVVLVAIAALVHWREVWAWVDGKTWAELSADLIGFALKWFFLALIGFAVSAIPHYVTPWLKLARLNGRRRLRDARRGGGVGRYSRKVDDLPRVDRNKLLIALMGELIEKRGKGGRNA